MQTSKFLMKKLKGGERMNKNMLITGIVVVLVGAGAFFGGMKYQQTQGASAFQAGAQAGRFGGRFGMGAGGQRFGAPTLGKVVSKDANSITVQMKDGSSKIVNLDSTTKIVKTSTASASDLTNGTEVAVFGSTNSDGSITAQNVQINPQIRQKQSPTPTP